MTLVQKEIKAAYIWKLSDEYQEVEYIESSGTQYIDTGYHPTIYDTIETKFQTQSTGSGDRNLYGSRGDYTEDFTVWINTSSGKGIAVHYPYYQYSTTDTGWFFTSDIINTARVLKVTPQYCYVDDTVYYTFSETRTDYGSGTYSAYLFTKNQGGSTSNTGSFKIYYFNISSNGTSQREFVPCYRKSDNVIGMYDLVNNQFYTNSGTGTFTKGPDVTNTRIPGTLKEHKIRPEVPATAYTLSDISTSDTNKYINVSQSGKTIQSVKFNFTATGYGAFVHISSNNSNTSRYGIACGYDTTGNYGQYCAIRGRLNGASDSWYRQVSFDTSTSNPIEFFISRDGNCYISVNGAKTSYTAGSAELNIIQTIMNYSDMNCYASQAGALLTGNKVDIEVVYS